MKIVIFLFLVQTQNLIFNFFFLTFVEDGLIIQNYIDEEGRGGRKAQLRFSQVYRSWNKFSNDESSKLDFAIIIFLNGISDKNLVRMCISHVVKPRKSLKLKYEPFPWA